MGRNCLMYVIFFAPYFIDGKKDCEFSLKNQIPKMPLILKNQNHTDFLYPKNNTLRLKRGEKFRLSCVNNKFRNYSVKEITATCYQYDRVQFKFHKRNQTVHLKDLECTSFPAATVRKIGRCYRNNTFIEIGFEIRSQFLNVFGVCFDEIEQNAIYSWYNSSMLFTGSYQSGVPRSTFQDGNMYSISVAKMYKKSNQRRKLKQILKSKELVRKYIKNDDKHFLARGHLTPKADFVYGAEQTATFQYINVAPQWQVFNGGNWLKIENKVRNLLKQNANRFGIITGTYDVATLPDIHGKEQELYLAKDKNNNNLLKVPKFIWKIIYDKLERTGIAVVGINNPYLEKIPDQYFVCEKYNCSNIKWLKLGNLTNIKKGYTYCCDMDSFFNATNFVNVFL